MDENTKENLLIRIKIGSDYSTFSCIVPFIDFISNK